MYDLVLPQTENQKTLRRTEKQQGGRRVHVDILLLIDIFYLS